jgi:hypothetical protein
MPAVQSSYNVTMRPGLAGMIADMQQRNVRSMVVEGASGLGFGVVAVKGTGDRQVKAATAGAAFVGITLADLTAAPGAVASSPDQYQDKDVAAVMTQGTVWVVVGAAVAAGDPAYFVPATGVITNVATANTPIPNAVFMSSAANGALAILHMR